MTSSITRSVETPELEIHYLEYGNQNGRPVVLLHGFPDSPISYNAVVTSLLSEGISQPLRIIVPYLRGFGRSRVTKPDLVAGQEAALGNDLLAFADALGIPAFHLVGHDWGARAAYAACLLAPNRVTSLLALATPYIMYGGREYPPRQIEANWYQWYFQLEGGRKAMTENAEDFCRQLWRSWSPGWKFANDDFAEAAEAWRSPQFVDTVLHYYRTRWGGALSVRAYSEMQAMLDRKPKAKISVPTIFVQGGADASDLPTCSEAQSEWFSGSYERVVLDVGHFPHRESPEAVARLLARQLG